jgi:hypothetical protein
MAQVPEPAEIETMKIVSSMFQILMNCSNYDDPLKKELCEHISLILLVAFVILGCAFIFCRVLGTQNGLTALTIFVVAIFGSFFMKEIITLKHDISSRVESLERNVISLDKRVAILEEPLNPYDVPTCCDAFEVHRKTTKLALNRIDANFTSVENRLSALESRNPHPTPGPTPERVCPDYLERISVLEHQVESLTSVAPQTYNEVGSWMEAVHVHRISHLDDKRSDIEAALKAMYIDVDKAFVGKDTPLAVSIKTVLQTRLLPTYTKFRFVVI